MCSYGNKLCISVCSNLNIIQQTRRQVGAKSDLIKLGEEPGYEVDVTSCKG